METAGFGGGCHWCTEGVFQILRGVSEVFQGFLQSTAPDDAWAEGVVVRFDPGIISLDILIEVHLRTHSANSGYSPNTRYRSAVYIGDANQRHRTDTVITRLGQEVDTAARTKVLPLVGFRSSEQRYPIITVPIRPDRSADAISTPSWPQSGTTSPGMFSPKATEYDRDLGGSHAMVGNTPAIPLPRPHFWRSRPSRLLARQQHLSDRHRRFCRRYGGQTCRSDSVFLYHRSYRLGMQPLHAEGGRDSCSANRSLYA